MKYKVSVFTALYSCRKNWFADGSFDDINEAYKALEKELESHRLACGNDCNLSDWRVEEVGEQSMIQYNVYSLSSDEVTWQLACTMGSDINEAFNMMHSQILSHDTCGASCMWSKPESWKVDEAKQ